MQERANIPGWFVPCCSTKVGHYSFSAPFSSSHDGVVVHQYARPPLRPRAMTRESSACAIRKKGSFCASFVPSGGSENDAGFRLKRKTRPRTLIESFVKSNVRRQPFSRMGPSNCSACHRKSARQESESKVLVCPQHTASQPR